MFSDRLKRQDYWGLAGAALLGVSAYAISIGYPFLFDDVRVIIQQPELNQLSNWKDVLAATWWPEGLYRPLTRLSIAFDWTVSDGNPHYFHAVNVALHAMATMLVFLVVRVTLGTVGATAAALLFAAHPVHVEAVANVVGRAEVLATLFALSAALLYHWDGVLAEARDLGWRRWLASFGTLASLVLGVASKESALAIPGILIMVDWLDGAGSHKPVATGLRRHAVLWLGAVALSVAWVMLRATVIGDFAGDFPGPGLYGQDFWGRLWVMAPVVLQYLRLFVFPYHLSADYSPNHIPAVASPTVLGLLGLAALAACIAGALRVRRSTPVITFALAWIGGTLLIVSNLIVPSGVLLAERSMYLPSVGVVLIAGWIVERTVSRWSRATTAVLVVVLALGVTRTVTRAQVWRGADIFYLKLVENASGSFRSQWTAGMIFYDRGNREEGERLLRAAIDTYPLFANVYFDLGRRLQEDGRWLEAAQSFDASFRIDSTRVGDAASAVVNYLRAGMPDTAQVIADRARSINPHHPRVFLAQADMAIAHSRPLEAMTWRRQANLVEPDAPGYWFLTADAAIRAEYCPEAIRSTARLRDVDPEFSELDTLDDRMRALGCDF